MIECIPPCIKVTANQPDHEFGGERSVTLTFFASDGDEISVALTPDAAFELSAELRTEAVRASDDEDDEA